MFKFLLREWRRLMCRIDFLFVGANSRRLFRDLEVDPDSLIRKGKL